MGIILYNTVQVRKYVVEWTEYFDIFLVVFTEWVEKNPESAISFTLVLVQKQSERAALVRIQWARKV